MKAGELAKALMEFDPKLEVFTEGCDCLGRSGSALLQKLDMPMPGSMWHEIGPYYILIERDHHG